MAQVTQNTQLLDRIDWLLDRSMRTWRSVSQDAEEFSAWSDPEKSDYLLEWDVEEDRLGQLEQLAWQGVLTVEQRKRYDELQSLVSEYRPLLEEMRAG